VGSGFSFEVVDATDYDDLRPGYAPDALRWILDRGDVPADGRVVDLAAGTGQVTRALAPLGRSVIAVEPAENMRRVLRARTRALAVVGARAEALPFADASIHAVVVGNAFHHFDEVPASAEIRRVLRPGAPLALLWARAGDGAFDVHPALRAIDEAAGVVRDRSRIASRYRSWYEPPSPPPGYSPFERRSFETTHEIVSRRFAALYATSSDIAALPREEREPLLAEIERLSATMPDSLSVPSRSEVVLAVRV
jgi:SAM-dependent methyltransferase